MKSRQRAKSKRIAAVTAEKKTDVKSRQVQRQQIEVACCWLHVAGGEGEGGDQQEQLRWHLRLDQFAVARLVGQIVAHSLIGLQIHWRTQLILPMSPFHLVTAKARLSLDNVFISA